MNIRNNITLTFVTFCLCFPGTINSVMGQEYPYSIDQYDFINYHENQIDFFNDSSKFDSLFSKFDELFFKGTGKVNIVHIGGSHIQADMWSGKVRRRLQKYSPGIQGGRGFVFPFKMAKTNNPYHYYPQFSGTWKYCKNSQSKKKCFMGLSGYVVTTTDSLTDIRVSFRGKGNIGYDFNRVKVFHDLDSTGYCLELKDTSIVHYRTMNDSLGYTEFWFKDYMDTLELEIYQSDTIQNHFSLYGLTLETSDPGFVYHAIGVNGASVPSYLKCQLFEPHLDALDPDLVILSIGINDAYDANFSRKVFEANYTSLLKMIFRAAPNTAVLFTTNNDSYYKRRYPNKNGELVRLSMIKLAKKYNCGLWDMYGVMGGYNSVKKWERAKLAKKDKIHFSRNGYKLVGDLMFNAIMKSYDNHIMIQN